MKYINIFEQHSDYLTYKESDDYIEPNISYCLLEDEIHFNKYVDPFNGYEYVDLGLPSGTLWATKNIGAESITDSGLYFAWGETTGYETKNQTTWLNYKFNNGTNTEPNMSKYNSTDRLTQLELEDDAAHVNMGGAWHTPTKEQLEELLNNTDYTFESNNYGVFISKINNKILYIPISLYPYGISVWTNTLLDTDITLSYMLGAGPPTAIVNLSYRYNLMPIRGVINI